MFPPETSAILRRSGLEFVVGETSSDTWFERGDGRSFSSSSSSSAPESLGFLLLCSHMSSIEHYPSLEDSLE